MTAPLWVNELAAAFWDMAGAAGEETAFPRDLRRPIARSLPLTVVLLPRLRLAAVDEWLERHGIVCSIESADRPLRACLVARRGQGIIFLDGADSAEEQRFSLAHELAHFLRHYWQPRRLVAERLGEKVVEVLDGERPPRPEERIDALLSLVAIGYHVHLMDRPREAEDAIQSDAIARAEREADRLAWELLAPGAEVLRLVVDVAPDGRRTAAQRLLCSYFGLPAGAAALYAACLLQGRTVDRGSDEAGLSLVRRLGLVR